MASQQPVTALSLAILARVPIVLWGDPGSGKSAVVRAVGEALGVPVETVIASIREPSDFGGLPIIVDGDVRLAPPAWATRLVESGRGILFLDEISTAPPAVQAALLRGVLERVVGDLPLPEGVAVVAAANPPKLAADGWDLSAPLANRFCHLDWQVDVRVFSEGMLAGFPAPAIPSLPADWESHIPVASSLVGSFVKVRPALMSDVPDDATRAGRAYPTPRSWDGTARLWAACEASDADDATRSVLVRGMVGEGAGIEFLRWARDMDLPNPEELLASPDEFELPERADRLAACVGAVVAVVVADPTQGRWRRGWRVVGRAASDAPDVAAFAAKPLARCMPLGETAPPEMKLFTAVLRDAGLMP